MADNLTPEQLQIIRLGEMAKEFLASEQWGMLVKPIIDSMIIGCKDATTIDVSSDKKASIEIKSRVEAAKYLSDIQTYIEAHIYAASNLLDMLEKQRGGGASGFE